MKQLLRLNQIRSKHRTSVEATVRALLVAWALHEGPTMQLRTLLSATTLPAAVVVSSWLLSGLGLDTMRQQVQGTWSEARVQACLPCLCRFLCSRPRRRGHQESAVRAWLEQRASPHSTQFSGNASTPSPSPCNWAGIPPFWVISHTDHLT